MSMEDLLSAMTEGDEPEEGDERAGNPLADLLGGLAGGAGGAEAGGAGDLLGSLLGAAAGSQGAADDTGDLLGSLLGGGAQSTPSAPSGAGGLGGLLGGGEADSSGGAPGLGGLLGGLLGGGSHTASNPLVQPIASAVADKLGISPQSAAVAVSLVLSKLLGALSGGSEAAPAQAATEAPGGFDLSQLLSQFSGGRADPEFLRSSGLLDEMTEQAGVDDSTAEASLQEVFSLLGSQAADSAPGVDLGEPEGGLDDLLGSW